MKNYYISQNGWSDICQHFSTFPDGSILSCRSLEQSPVCIKGQNANSICLEHLGNFDLVGDEMTAEQRVTIIQMTAILCRSFTIPVDSQSIVYHHWFDLSTGQKNDGSRNYKSCPGTIFLVEIRLLIVLLIFYLLFYRQFLYRLFFNFPGWRLLAPSLF